MILAAFWIVNQDSTSQGVKIFFEVLCEEVFSIPMCKRKEQTARRKKWVNSIRRKDFVASF